MGKYIDKIYVGAIGENMHGQKYEIVDIGKNNNSKVVTVKFLDTGYEVDTYNSNIHKGHIKDRFEKTSYGVGAVGYKRDYKDPHYRKIFTHWNLMIRRCYDKNDKQYCNYGGEGVTVCERWHYFHNFYDDFRKLDGYSEEIMKVSKFRHLDKDIKQQFAHNSTKVYSLKTCKLVLKDENEKYKRQKPRPYVRVTNPAGTEFYINNCTEFIKQTNYKIRDKYINYCLTGKQEHHLGWKFEKVSQLEYEAFHKEFPYAPEYPEEQDMIYIYKDRYRHRKKPEDVEYDSAIHIKRHFNEVL